MPVARWGLGVCRGVQAVLLFGMEAEPVGYQQGGIGVTGGGDSRTCRGYQYAVELGTFCSLWNVNQLSRITFWL